MTLRRKSYWRVDQPLRHLQSGVGDLFSPGRAFAARRQRLVDGFDELAHRLDRDPLSRLNRLEYLLRSSVPQVERARRRLHLDCSTRADRRFLLWRRPSLDLGLGHYIRLLVLRTSRNELRGGREPAARNLRG
jgi:hypothetical protein